MQHPGYLILPPKVVGLSRIKIGSIILFIAYLIMFIGAILGEAIFFKGTTTIFLGRGGGELFASSLTASSITLIIGYVLYITAFILIYIGINLLSREKPVEYASLKLFMLVFSIVTTIIGIIGASLLLAASIAKPITSSEAELVATEMITGTALSIIALFFVWVSNGVLSILSSKLFNVYKKYGLLVTAFALFIVPVIGALMIYLESSILQSIEIGKIIEEQKKEAEKTEEKAEG
jgi:hypothetical protein